MKCDQCGHEVAERPSVDPWCMYKMENGKVINAMFDPTQIPEGWYDSPGAAFKALPVEELFDPEKIEPKAKKVANDNSARPDNLRS